MAGSEEEVGDGHTRTLKPPGRSLLVVGAGLGPQVLFSTSQAISGLFNQPNPTGGPMSLVRGSHPNVLFWTLLASKAT